jgi:hypothetical protein
MRGGWPEEIRRHLRYCVIERIRGQPLPNPVRVGLGANQRQRKSHGKVTSLLKECRRNDFEFIDVKSFAGDRLKGDPNVRPLIKTDRNNADRQFIGFYRFPSLQMEKSILP